MTSETAKKEKPRPFLRLKYNPPISPTLPNTSSCCPAYGRTPGRTPHKSPISSLFFTGNSATATPSSKKMQLKSAAFRGLGCASAAEASAPENLVRSSADWQGKRVRKKKQRSGRKKKHSLGDSNPMVLSDVWCAPGIGFATDATSVDCVVARRAPGGTGAARGRGDGDRNLAQRSCITRRVTHYVDYNQSQDSSPIFEIPRSRSDILTAGNYRHFRGMRHSPGGLAEIVMFQTSFLPGVSNRYDQFRDMRLDVDSMSYEELLELGDKIGYVNTGLRDEEIIRCLSRAKYSIVDPSSSQLSPAMELKCSICQEEYEANDDVGKLECAHTYHLYCIKQWLLQKNACPVCKTAAVQQ